MVSGLDRPGDVALRPIADCVHVRDDGVTVTWFADELDGAQPDRISVDTIQTDSGTEVSETFTVRYIDAVTWNMSHHGLS